MIANFFQSLSDHGVQYLLMSGQATVLYGAATFSEDIDLWINPTNENRLRVLKALRACGARYYKLTPPFELAYMRRGHGFHLTLPQGPDPEAFVDLMGKPPRLGSFESALPSAQWMDTDWGWILTMGLKDLVEVKKTQRLEDYPVISRLALHWCEQSVDSGTLTSDYQWVVGNIFTLQELQLLFEHYPDAVDTLPIGSPPELSEFACRARAEEEVSEEVVSEVTRWMQDRIQRFQQADRFYWRQIIAELRQLRTAGKLMPEGAAI